MEEKQFENPLTKVYPNGLTGKEIIRRIQEVYHAGYDLDNPDFDIYDQLLACEAVAEAEQERHEELDTNVSVNGNDNDTYKRIVNFELTESKLNVIKKLQTCTYQTPPIEISRLLEELFAEYPSKPGHWNYISQVYTPRTINRVIKRINKLHITRAKTIQNPAAYFTFLIKFRKKRKISNYQWYL